MSSNVESAKRVGGDVVVTFKGGQRYRYYGVPQDVFDAYGEAESKGSFVARELRGRYRTQKLGEDDEG